MTEPFQALGIGPAPASWLPLQAPVAGSAVLVLRGNCSFLDKALTAQKAGARAVLVANTQDGEKAAALAVLVANTEEGG